MAAGRRAEQGAGIQIIKLSSCRLRVAGNGFRLYALKHQDQFPTDFAQAAPYVGEALRNDLNPGDVLRDQADFIAQVTNRFEILYSGWTTNAEDGDKIMFRERQPTRAEDGSWMKAYGFVDGSGQLHSEADGNFDGWESQHTSGSVVRTEVSAGGNTRPGQ